MIIISFLKGIKTLETVKLRKFDTNCNEINNQSNWLLDLYKKSRFLQYTSKFFQSLNKFQDSFLTTKEIEILSRRQLRNQQTIQRTIDYEEQIEDKDYKKELLQSLIENENDKVKFQNTKNNVAITNSQQKTSKMCKLM
jgi:hypothetical protein